MRYIIYLLLILPSLGLAEQNLRILLTNDDGYESPGLQILRTALIDAGHDVYVIAPATQQSGASASVTGRGVDVTPYPDQVWAVHGKPADAVRVGLGNIMFNEPPDLVVSGANLGQNTGRDVNISGTVGAAVTAFHLGVPAIAISVEIKLDEMDKGFPSTVGAFKGAATLMTRLIDNLKLQDMTAVLNVNYPARLPLDVRGVRWSSLSDHSLFAKRYNINPEGKYVPELQSPHRNARAHDAESLAEGFVTLTFLDGDMSTSVRRGQRYLDRHLLDRTYEPTARPVRKAPAAKPSEPAARTIAPAAGRKEPAASPEPVKDPSPEPSVLNERKPVEPVIQLPVTHASDIQDEPLSEDAPAEVQQADEGQAEPKKKPDSWLRRMFDPKSWGN